MTPTVTPTVTRSPIYVGGLDRSGKTWMRFILTGHPNIVMSRRTNLWTHVYNRFGNLSRTENFERCLAALLRSKHVQLLAPDPERIRREFRQGEPTYARLFALLHQHYAEQQGKPRWGDQTEHLERCADLLFAAHPDAKMIHMIRDPRDRYEAVLARTPTDRWRAGGAAALWLSSVRLAERNLQRYPSQYRVVRFESLIAQPEKTVAEVCDFLGEEYVPEMLLLRDVPRFSAITKTGRSPISPDYIGRYRGAISKREIAFIQMLASRKMQEHGYALEPVHFSPADWLTFSCLAFPANLVRALAWRTLAASQQGAA